MVVDNGAARLAEREEEEQRGLVFLEREAEDPRKKTGDRKMIFLKVFLCKWLCNPLHFTAFFLYFST